MSETTNLVALFETVTTELEAGRLAPAPSPARAVVVCARCDGRGFVDGHVAGWHGSFAYRRPVACGCR